MPAGTKYNSRMKPLIVLLLIGAYLGVSAQWFAGSHAYGTSAFGLLKDTITKRDGTPPQKSRIILDHADQLTFDKDINPNAQRLLGNVAFTHGNARMFCDSAYIDEQTQTFEAFGNVHMIQADTVNIYAQYLYYDGIQKLAKLRNNVRLENRKTTLYTDSLDYDRVADLAYYFDGGTIVDSLNTLTSDYGQYSPQTDDAEFRDNVKLENDKAVMHTEILFYNTKTQIGRFEGQTTIESDSGMIVSTRGVYDSQKDLSILLDRSLVQSGAKTLTGDSIYYDRKNLFGEAFGNMQISDTVKKVSLFGDYGYYDENRDYAFTTSKAFVMDFSKADTLYIGADTLELITWGKEKKPVAKSDAKPINDSLPSKTLSPNDTTVNHILKAYHHVKVYRKDVQAVSDSLVGISIDSIMYMYGSPVMWNENYQLSGDTVRFDFKKEKLDKAYIFSNAFVLEDLKEDRFNQAKGDWMKVIMRDSLAKQIEIHGKAESINYLKEENDTTYSGLNRIKSDGNYIYLNEAGKSEKILWVGPATGKIFPLRLARTAEVNQLEGFKLHNDIRPKTRYDVISGIGTIDSTGQVTTALPDYSRFKGADAALRAYNSLAEIAKAAAQERRKDAQAEEQTKLSPYILRDNKDRDIDILKQIINLSWVFKVSTSNDVQDNSIISPSIGIPKKSNSKNESSESEKK